ncbi:MAG TPA: hypothetical protein VN605_13935, partial [Thermoanaerobaculia bacterium]|nr:hypothetical protein [Thermoanaerobaculia bacterium]
LEIWGVNEGLDEIRRTTVAVRGMVAAHPNGKLLNFCPGLAEMMTGSAMTVPAEVEEQARVVRDVMSAED